jgi:hypothetical protein
MKNSGCIRYLRSRRRADVLIYFLGDTINRALHGILQVRHNIISVVGVQLDMRPNHLLRVIDLVHYKSHQNLDYSVTAHAYLDRQKDLFVRSVVINKLY